MIVSSGWLGLSVAMVSLAVGAAGNTDPAFRTTSYDLMTRIGGVVIAAFAVATLVSGAVLSGTTPWGFLRHRWVVVKLVLTLTVIVTAIGITNGWMERAAAGGSAWLVVGGAASHLLMPAAAALISVDKPWGPTRRGARAAGLR